jgi:hypothetical protein
MGRYESWGKGRAEVICLHDDVYQYTLTFEYKIYDPYDWHLGKGVTIAGVPITDRLMFRLHREAYAKQYVIRGSIFDTYTWRSDEEE